MTMRCPFCDRRATHSVRWLVGANQEMPDGRWLPVPCRRVLCWSCAWDVLRFQRSIGVEMRGPYPRNRR